LRDLPIFEPGGAAFETAFLIEITAPEIGQCLCQEFLKNLFDIGCDKTKKEG
jgi:hypothetical protein